jgi:hypothetical protein
MTYAEFYSNISFLGKEISPNRFDLDWSNGWSQETREFYRALRPFQIPNAGSTEKRWNCVYRYTSVFNIAGVQCSITYCEDSGD